MRRITLSISLLIFLAGCGDDTQPSGNPDGGGEDGPAGACATGWDQLALDGTIWTLDQNVPSVGQFPAVVRFDVTSGQLAATYNGVPASSTTVSASALGWHRMGSMTLSDRTFTACARPADGIIDGTLTYCAPMGGSCTTGSFHMIKLARRPGEGESSPNVTKLGEFGGTGWTSITANVRVDDARKLAVLARYDDGMRILSLDPATTPWTITEVSHVDTEDHGTMTREIYNDVKLLYANGKHYALMASSTHGVVIFDITDPAAPQLKAHVRNGENVHTAFIVGTTLYMGDLDIGGLAIADVSNPEAPADLGQFVLSGAAGDVFVHDLYVEPGRAYLDYWGAGLVIVDVTNPASPQKLGQFTYDRMTNHSNWVTTINGRKICLTGDEDFTAHGRELDVTDPANIRLVGEYGQDRPQVSIHNILADGDKAYVAYYMDGLRILQLSDSAAPTLLGYYNSWPGDASDGYDFYEGAIGVDKIGNVAYLADEYRGLIVLQVP